MYGPNVKLMPWTPGNPFNVIMLLRCFLRKIIISLRNCFAIRMTSSLFGKYFLGSNGSEFSSGHICAVSMFKSYK